MGYFGSGDCQEIWGGIAWKQLELYLSQYWSLQPLEALDSYFLKT